MDGAPFRLSVRAIVTATATDFAPAITPRRMGITEITVATGDGAISSGNHSYSVGMHQLAFRLC